MKKETSFLKKRKTTIGFAIVSLMGGILFLNKSITANVILNENYTTNFISLVGLLLIICSIILVAYSIKKRG